MKNELTEVLEENAYDLVVRAMNEYKESFFLLNYDKAAEAFATARDFFLAYTLAGIIDFKSKNYEPLLTMINKAKEELENLSLIENKEYIRKAII